MVQQTLESKAIADALYPSFRKMSPYATWLPIEEMDMGIAKPSATRTLPEIETFANKGRFIMSDMFILKAIDTLTYASLPAIHNLLRYMKARDYEEAHLKGRSPLAIPATDDMNPLWERVRALCGMGLVIRNRYLPERSSWESEEGKLNHKYYYHLPGVSSQVYRSYLQDFRKKFNPSKKFLPECEVFRYVSAAYLATSMLVNRFLVDAKFGYPLVIQKDRKRETVELPAVLTMNPNGRKGNEAESEIVVIDSITLNTNTNLITRDSRIDWLYRRVGELKMAFDHYAQTGGIRFIIIGEDASSITTIRNAIYDIDPNMLRVTLFTSGAVLDDFDLANSPERIRKSFVEFRVVKNGERTMFEFDGAVGYYWLRFEKPVVI